EEAGGAGGGTGRGPGGVGPPTRRRHARALGSAYMYAPKGPAIRAGGAPVLHRGAARADVSAAARGAGTDSAIGTGGHAGTGTAPCGPAWAGGETAPNGAKAAGVCFLLISQYDCQGCHKQGR